MHRRTAFAFAVFLMSAGSFFSAGALFAAPAAKGVQVLPDGTQRRVDITIDGQPFTSYIWPTTLKKPVLYPIVDSDGITLTRGYPLAPRAGERTDHPHHDGLWFNYSNVNGYDFWNNSDAIPAVRAPKMGTIRFDRIVSTSSGAHRGELVTESTWIDRKRQAHPRGNHAVCVREPQRGAHDRPYSDASRAGPGYLPR